MPATTRPRAEGSGAVARPSEPATDCHFSLKAAVRDAGATPSRGITTAAGGPGANADCRFPGDAAAARCTSGNSSGEDRAQSHTPEDGSPPVDGAPGPEAALQPAAVRPARALDSAPAVHAGPPANDAPCARTSRTAASLPRSPVDAAYPPPVDRPFSVAAPGVPVVGAGEPFHRAPQRARATRGPRPIAHAVRPRRRSGGCAATHRGHGEAAAAVPGRHPGMR